LLQLVLLDDDPRYTDIKKNSNTDELYHEY